MEQDKATHYFTPEQIAPLFAANAVKKAAMPTARFIVYAILGGAFIALGGLFSMIVAGGVPGLMANYPGLVKMLAGLFFPMGLVLVVVAGAGLFTSDCATLPFAWWQNKISGRKVLKIAGIGYLANFAGALMVAWFFSYETGTIAKSPWLDYATHLAVQKTSSGFWTVFFKGMGANLMVCLAVWMATAAKDIAGKVLLIWMPVMAFVALGWEHSIANMFFIPLGMMLGAPVSIEAFLWGNLLPATLGNIVGGMLLVALPYYYLWGQTEKKKKLVAEQVSDKNEPSGPTISNREAIEQDLFKILN
jgi:formate/nitrite transporter